ncbi:hypothetical protein [Streptomyces sp. NPDC005408]|uniref:hypothetical protein n=1 Tax=Streptomyces sp. NPDC005408 TaxID=3155341 RepID=UPI0033BEAFC1
MRQRLVPLALLLLAVVVGLLFVAAGLRGRSADVVCPGENSPAGSQGEEVPGPMHPGDTSCAVILPGGKYGGTRTYEEQKSIQVQEARHDVWIGAAVIAGGGAGIVWIGLRGGMRSARRWRTRRGDNAS